MASARESPRSCRGAGTCETCKDFCPSESRAAVVASERPRPTISSPNCTWSKSTVFCIFWMVGTYLCVTKGTFTALSMNWVCGIATVWTVGACRCATTGKSKSQRCSRAAPVGSLQCSAWFALWYLFLLRRASKMRLSDSSECFCHEELDLILNLIHTVARVCRSPPSWPV